MGIISTTANTTYRDFASDGIASSGRHEPAKTEIRALFSAVDLAIYAAQAGLAVAADLAARDAFFATTANRTKLVYVNNHNGAADDPANGVYEYVGSAARFAEGFYQGLALVVQPLVDDAEAAAVAAAASAASVSGTAEKTGRYDAQIAARDGAGRSIAIVDAGGLIEAPRFPAWIVAMADRVLFDLLASGAARWRGSWRHDDVYSLGDVVQTGLAMFWFCKLDASRRIVSPDADAVYWEPIPLITAETTEFDDDYTASPGAANGRTVMGKTYATTGTGFAAATVGSGYMTSAGNTYYTLSGFVNGMSEVIVDHFATAAPFVHTLAISPTNAGYVSNIFNGMWHSNWYTDLVGDSTYWDVGDTIAVPARTPVYRFFWRAAVAAPAGVAYEMAQKIRGNWIFGYLNGRHVYTELADKIGALVGGRNARSLYLQNHTLSGTGGNGDVLGGERILRLRVKAAA